MIKYFYAILFTVVSAISVFGQAEITVSDAQGDPGDVVSVDVNVKGFSNLFGFQLLATFDETKLNATSVVNISSALSNFNEEDGVTIDNEEGVVFLSYLDLSSDDGFTIPEDGRLFTIEFEIVAENSTTATVDFPQEVDYGNEPREQEVINNQIENIGATTNAGTVTIGEGGGGGGNRVSMSLGSGEGQSGETVCVPITVNNFTDLVGMEFSIEFDTDFMEYVEARDFDLTGFNESAFSTEFLEDGALIVQWTSPSSDPISTADGTVIGNLCFRINQSSGSSDLSFTNDPREILFAVLNEQGDAVATDYNVSDGEISAGDGGGGGGNDCELEGFSLSADNIASPKGSEVCVNFYGKDIVRIGGIQTLVTWDPEVLNNPEFEYVNLPEPQGGAFDLSEGANGILKLAWSHGSGMTLDDNSILFKLCFDVIGEDGESTEITFEEREGFSFLAADLDGNEIPFQACDGSFTVGEGEGVSIASSPPSCAGDSDGSIDMSVLTGESPYSFSWTLDGNEIATSEDLDGLAAGTYVYTVVDNTGETIAEGSVELNDPDPIVVDYEVGPVESGNDGSIDITVSGGSGGYMYNWSTGEDTEDISGLGEGTFTVTVTDNSGCSVNEDIPVGPAEFSVQINATTDYNGFDISCFGEMNASLRAVANFGTEPYNYVWSTGDETESIQNVGSGEYSVTVTDADGNSTSTTYMVNEPEQLVVRVNTTPSNGGSAGTAQAIVTGGAEPYTYSWNDGMPGSTTSFIGGLEEGAYRVVVTDANNCLTEREARVPVDDQDCFTAVEVMTPNADGLNDELRIACVQGSQNTLTIFDRWGAAVYRQENYDNSWTGISNDGDELDDGVYYFVIEVTEADGTINQYKGHVTLLRRLN
ncbi:cohesin domain-containing protein [Membranihabitans maritimus]|uniref:cohesin domain-containing protein n=1 Tax=Membranihabitans maritimus TaxID=2904244 RepID=UPI001F02DD69|nr:cohesin domain-containing protein [Membranihabitans maritimus]